MAGVGPPTAGAPERQAVRAMFDQIAPRYDVLNRVLSAGIDRRWRRTCIDDLSLEVPSRVLDVCAGTADLMIEFLRRDPGHLAVGVDLSGVMLERGRAKLEKDGFGARGWLASADAQKLPFPDQSFDGASIGFGIRNVADRLAALREIYRVLRPGSRLVILEFSMPTGRLGRFYRFYLDRVLPRVGGIVSGNAAAYRYLPDSVAHFPPPRDFAGLMQDAGFDHVRWRKLSLGIVSLYRGERRQ
jgi:demethylmenaquinone methyltransferase / 2-methoxy-6-polyprenyl-1,4-benzoquinol methylase